MSATSKSRATMATDNGPHDAGVWDALYETSVGAPWNPPGYKAIAEAEARGRWLEAERERLLSIVRSVLSLCQSVVAVRPGPAHRLLAEDKHSAYYRGHRQGGYDAYSRVLGIVATKDGE